MSFGSGSVKKVEYAATLAATLGYFLELQADAIGLLTFADTLREYLPARHRPGHLRQFMLKLENPTTGEITNIEKPLQRISELVHKRGLIVIISDFLTSLTTIEKNLRQLRAWGHELALFQTLDRSEIDLNLEQASLFQDVESGRELYIDPSLARSEYQKKFSAHNEFLAAACRALGVAYHLVPTDRPMEKSLQDFLLDRRKFGKVLRRNSPAG